MAKGQSIVRLTLESQQYERNLKQAQRQFNEFVKGIGLSIPKISAMSAAIGATSAALKVAKDAFFKNEQNLDAWAKMVKSSESVYSGFLNALNNGDISGFLNSIDKITKAAREAYDALDALGTFNAFNQINVQRTRTGMAEAIAGYREGNASKDDVRASGEAYKRELKKRAKLETDAYKKEVARVAAELGVDAGAFGRVLAGSSENYDRIKSTMPSGRRTTFTGGGMFGGSTAVTVRVPQNATEKMGDALRKLNDTELDHLQALGAQAQRTGEEVAQVDKQLTRILNGRGSGGSGGGKGGGKGGGTGGGGGNGIVKTEMQLNSEQIEELAKAYEKASEERRAEIKKEIKALQDRNEEIQKYYDIATGKRLEPTGDGKVSNLVTSPVSFATAPSMSIGSLRQNMSLGELESMLSAVRELQKSATDSDSFSQFERSIKGIQGKINKITGQEDKADKRDVKLLGEVGHMANGISGVFSGIEQLGIELPEGLKDILGGITSVITVLSGIATIVTAIEAIAAADTLIPFHTGGVARAAGGMVVPGNWGHDAVPALLQSGEVVFNRAQVGNLESQLSNNNAGLELTATLKGEDLVLAIQNNRRKTGRGVFVTSKFIA